MGDNKTEQKDAKPAEEHEPARPPVDLHDPFSRFEFEPTDGGDF